MIEAHAKESSFFWRAARDEGLGRPYAFHYQAFARRGSINESKGGFVPALENSGGEPIITIAAPDKKG